MVLNLAVFFVECFFGLMLAIAMLGGLYLLLCGFLAVISGMMGVIAKMQKPNYTWGKRR